MKSRNIENEVEELTLKFQELESKSKTLQDKAIKDNLQLRERIVQLEETNIAQERKLHQLLKQHARKDLKLKKRVATVDHFNKHSTTSI